MKKKSLPGKTSMFFRSFIFVSVVGVFTAFWSFVCLASYVLPFRYRHRVVVFWTQSVVWFLKVVCCIDYHVTGLEHVPRDRPCVVMSKHQSAWETFYLPQHFHQTAIILKRELFWVPFFGWGLAAMDPIGINRSDKVTALAQIIEQGKKYVAKGRWILVFPEGTRIAPGHTGKYRSGGAKLAVAIGCPILPVAHNAGNFWRKRQFVKRPGTIQVVFGPLIETKGRTAQEVIALTQNWIEETVQKLNAKTSRRTCG